MIRADQPNVAKRFAATFFPVGIAKIDLNLRSFRRGTPYVWIFQIEFHDEPFDLGH